MRESFQWEKTSPRSQPLPKRLGLLGVRTTHASLQFIILWGRVQLPKRQLSIARDPDIKPHRDCCMKKHYHLAPTLIMLRERQSTSKREIAGVIKTSLRGELIKCVMSSLAVLRYPDQNVVGPKIVPLIWSYGFIVTYTMSKIDQTSQQMQTNLKHHYGNNQSGWQHVNSATSLLMGVCLEGLICITVSIKLSHVWHILSSIMTYYFSSMRKLKEAVMQNVLIKHSVKSFLFYKEQNTPVK